MHLYSYQDRTFLLIDGRSSNVRRFGMASVVHALCVMHSLDAVLILRKNGCPEADFSSEAYLADGSPAPLNSESAAGLAVCLVAYADLLGVKPFHSLDYAIEADGEMLRALIHSQLGECKRVSIYRDEMLLGTGEALCLGEFDV